MTNPKKPKGRPSKYNEETAPLNLYVPIGAREGVIKLVKEYLDIYMAKKKLDELKKLTK